MRDIRLKSGKWRWTVATEASFGVETLELFDPAAPHDRMTVTLPFSWRQLGPDRIAQFAREPAVRLWTDEAGIPWRISRVGPGTHHPYDLRQPHLFFDSVKAYAGLVPLDPNARLGDLTRDELRRYRDSIRDFGGRRRAYRPPTARTA